MIKKITSMIKIWDEHRYTITPWPQYRKRMSIFGITFTIKSWGEPGW